jgi:hypothetical protein
MEARDFVEIVEAHNLDAADTEACVIASIAEPKHISVVVAGLRTHFPEADAVRSCASFEDAAATFGGKPCAISRSRSCLHIQIADLSPEAHQTIVKGGGQR